MYRTGSGLQSVVCSTELKNREIYFVKRLSFGCSMGIAKTETGNAQLLISDADWLRALLGVEDSLYLIELSSCLCSWTRLIIC